jgi:hypothetical protein
MPTSLQYQPIGVNMENLDKPARLATDWDLANDRFVCQAGNAIGATAYYGYQSGDPLSYQELPSHRRKRRANYQMQH